MKVENINFTPNAIELIKNAYVIARKGNFNAIHPVHLFLGVLKIDCEIIKELKAMVFIDEKYIEASLNELIMEKSFSEYVQIKDKDSTEINISSLTRDILLEAKRITELYEEHGQIFIDNGQILKAILNSDEIVTKRCLKELDKDLIISIIASPRDLIVDLSNDFTMDSIKDISIRKVGENDKKMVREFVLEKFYERWTNTIDYGLILEDIPIYIAIHENNIVGFAGYNISRQRKGYFGPLGVLKSYRDRKIGQVLVNACLIDMKQLGYETCIIGNASSIEFYRKACGARIVPMLEKENSNYS